MKSGFKSDPGQVSRDFRTGTRETQTASPVLFVGAGMAKRLVKSAGADCRSTRGRRGARVEATGAERDGLRHEPAAGALLLPEGTVLRKAPRPSGCTRFVRREISGAMPAICAMLLTRTLEGDLSALKLLLQMAVESQAAEGRAAKRVAGSAGFARKVLDGFKTWEAGETSKRHVR